MNESSLLDQLLVDVKQKYFKELPSWLTYHNFGHTFLVTHLSKLLAKEASLSKDDHDCLCAAAIFHDSGYSKKYWKNEQIGAQNAKADLPKYGFSPEQIELVEGLIYATDYNLIAKTKLEKVIKDADLGYLGHQNFLYWSDRLLQEYRNKKVFTGSDSEWLTNQIEFLSQHHFFTKEGITLFESGKQENILLLRTLDKWPF